MLLLTPLLLLLLIIPFYRLDALARLTPGNSVKALKAEKAVEVYNNNNNNNNTRLTAFCPGLFGWS